MYKSLLRPLLFQFDSEKVHDFVYRLISSTDDTFLTSLLDKLRFEDPLLRVNLAGIDFQNPIGLAAGFDKNCSAVPFWEALGFGHVEVGTVTGDPQPGNPKPRIRRFAENEALVNSMGFPSKGSEEIGRTLSAVRSHKRKIKIGVNIGKTKNVPIESAELDYLKSFKTLHPFADYIAINVSSPNTPDLRKLQEPARLTGLFQSLQEENKRSIPLFVKIAPDLTQSEVERILAVCHQCKIAGVIASNTTISRENLPSAVDLPGGVSGKPVIQKNLSIVKFIHLLDKNLPIIAVGGIFSPQDALNYLEAGASMVQLYTGFIYEGPFVVRALLKGLIKLKNN